MSAPRIIAGDWRGRRLEVPPGNTVRPTSERMREALFNILGGDIQDAVLLDLFAGSGAIGLEALSRGARHVTFIERDRAALAALEGNIARLDAAHKCRVIAGDAVHADYGRQIFDIVYLDPPYASDMLAPCLARLAGSDLMADACQVIVEHASQWPVPVTPPFALVRERRYGAGALAFLSLRPTDATVDD